MAYPEIEREKVERLKSFVGKEIELAEYTSEYIDPLSAPKGQAASRDDWEQYGGYPGRTLESTRFIKIILVSIFGSEKEGKLFPEYIIGKDGEGLKIYPYRTWAVSWIISVRFGDEILWNSGRGSLSDEEGKIRQISEQELEKLKKELVQIVP
ncbi:MAG: hypothetical protein Q8N58_00950 [bacterium]|nr:hypothetical protein [bacterium]